MRLKCEHRPLFLKRELGFLFRIALILAVLLIPFEYVEYANSAVINMPKPLPDIVKNYKSVRVWAGTSGLNHTGFKVNRGDYVTILAKGSINLWPTRGKEYEYGPKALLLFQLGDKDYPVREYKGPDLMEVTNNGGIYLGYRGSEMNYYGRPLNPGDFNDDVGSFYVDVIVWKTPDRKLIIKFLEEASLAQPKDEDLKEMAQHFKNWHEYLLTFEEKKKEVEEIRKELSVAEGKEVLEPPLSTVVQPQEEKKTVEELRERLQKAMQSLKELEEMKKKLTEKEEKESQLLARLETMEKERSIQSKNVPVIAVGYPRDGISVDSDYISLFGVAEHDKGITKFEILVNKKLVVLKDQRDLSVATKDRRRIEFSERIRLQGGQNTISINVQGSEGLTSQKTISIQLAKKKENVYAVVIGINKYKNFPSLKYATNDAQEFYRYLVEVNQIPKEHIWLILDEEATLDKLRTILGTSLRRSAGKEDSVIIFLAGHGATEQDASTPDSDGLEKYILPHNADPKNLYATALPMGEIARIFQRINSERLIFISDTCYSGASGGRTILQTGTRSNLSGAFLERLSQGKGRVILTASDVNEVSGEKDEFRHGIFTYYLLEGLRGKADLDQDGLITLDEIYRYVSLKVPLATEQNQHPVKKGETTGQIILGVVK